MKLLHISWSLPTNEIRRACDVFFSETFAAQTGFEIQISEDMKGTGMGREESLMLIGNTMLIPLAAVGNWSGEDASVGDMLNSLAQDQMWVGVALQVEDLAAADRWCRTLNLTPKYRPGMEQKYFVLDRKRTLGVRFEIITGELPNDPRLTEDWDPNWWRDHHPLGIIDLQSIGVCVADLDEARAVLTDTFGFPEIAAYQRDDESAACAAFHVAGTLMEAMAPTKPESTLAHHLRAVRGIYCLTFRVKSVKAAAQYLAGKSLRLIGDTSRRFAIDPAQAYGRRIYFVQDNIDGDPRRTAPEARS